MTEGLNQNNEIEIKPIGSYFEVDEDGYLVNPTSLEKIQADWKPAINDTVELYKKQFASKLKNVYIRGSVATGDAIKNISDLDTFAYVDLPENEITKAWAKDLNIDLRKKYPFITDVELNARPLVSSKNKNYKLSKALCVYGDPLEVSKMRPGKSMMNHIYKLADKLSNLEERLKTDNPTELKSQCCFLMKEILRSGFDITMERSKKYTRDLYPCYMDFSEYYPDKESQMKEVLKYALNPINDREKIKQVIDSIVPWLLEEAKKYI